MGGAAHKVGESTVGGTSASDWHVEKRSQELEEENTGFKINAETNISIRKDRKLSKKESIGFKVKRLGSWNTHRLMIKKYSRDTTRGGKAMT